MTRTAMDVLVLGGTGFLGLHVTRALSAGGHRVHRLNRGRTPVPAGFAAATIVADRDDAAGMARVVRRAPVDAVVDLSGYRPDQVRPVLAALAGRHCHYLFCSTVAVYARDAAAPVAETTPPDPAHDYGRDKLACERLLWDRTVAATVLRLAPVFGPWDYKCRELFYLRRIANGAVVRLPDGGRRLVHLASAAHVGRLVAALVGHERSWGAVYNVATGAPMLLRGYAELLARAVGRPARFEPVPGEPTPADYRRVPYAKPYDQAYRTDALAAVVPDRGDLAGDLRATVRWYAELGEQRLLDRVRQLEADYPPAAGRYADGLARDLTGGLGVPS